MHVQLQLLVILRIQELAQLFTKLFFFGRIERLAAEVVGGPAADEDERMRNGEVLPELGLDGIGLEPGKDLLPESGKFGVGVRCGRFEVHVADYGDWGCCSCGHGCKRDLLAKLTVIEGAEKETSST